MKNFFSILLASMLVISCTKNDEPHSGNFLSGNGVFVVNEGNFLTGNGSVSFYSYDSLKIYNDLFSEINGRPLGDVPNSAEIYGDKLYIVVNNTGKIEVVKKSTLESVATISGLNSPRNIAFVNSSKAYVSSIYSDSLIVLNLNTNSIAGYINIRRTSESIVVADGKAFAASWVGGHEVMVINTADDAVADSIEVGVEPESMVLDASNTLWVLCNGGWMREHYAEIDGINTTDNSISKRLVFSNIQESPSCLKIDGSGQNLYYLDGGVRKMNVSASSLPESALIPQTDHFFYKLGIDPSTGDIFVTDAVDYTQRGYLLNYDNSGTLKNTLQAQIIPGSMCFKASAK